VIDVRWFSRGGTEFCTLAVCRDVVRRALKTAAVVGVILVVINHGAAPLDGARLARIMLTFAVP
jgi:hypothetical protein